MAKTEQPCWTCKRYHGLPVDGTYCEYAKSKAKIPVQGWKAKKIYRGAEEFTAILYCPKYLDDGTGERERREGRISSDILYDPNSSFDGLRMYDLIRKAYGSDLRKFAIESELSYESIRSFVMSRREPCARTYSKIAKTLHISCDELYQKTRKEE